MTWKSTMRQINAGYKRAERAERRRQRELGQQQNLYAKMQEQEKAAYDAQVFENHISLLQSVHRESSDVCDWAKILNAAMPDAPMRSSEHEAVAQLALDGFKVSFKDKLLGKGESKRNELVKNLEAAKMQDESEYENILEIYKNDCADLEKMKEIAKGVLAGDLNSYQNAIKAAQPFSDISAFGSSIIFNINRVDQIEVTLHVNDERIMPTEAKSLTKSGKLSIKPIPKSKFYEIYQDYVCGCVFRISRELFALLPTEMVIVTCMGNILNTQTGHMEEKPILSVAMPRATVDKLNFDALDPSDALVNFVHNMDFKKGKGFNAVETIIIS